MRLTPPTGCPPVRFTWSCGSARHSRNRYRCRATDPNGAAPKMSRQTFVSMASGRWSCRVLSSRSVLLAVGDRASGSPGRVSRRWPASDSATAIACAASPSPSTSASAHLAKGSAVMIAARRQSHLRDGTVVHDEVVARARSHVVAGSGGGVLRRFTAARRSSTGHCGRASALTDGARSAGASPAGGSLCRGAQRGASSRGPCGRVRSAPVDTGVCVAPRPLGSSVAPSTSNRAARRMLHEVVGDQIVEGDVAGGARVAGSPPSARRGSGRSTCWRRCRGAAPPRARGRRARCAPDARASCRRERRRRRAPPRRPQAP